MSVGALLFGVLGTHLQDPVPWVDSFPKGAVLARHRGKPILAYFRAEWCEGCRSLENHALRDAKVAEAIRSTVPVRVDMDREPDIAERYGVRFFPAFAIVDPTGERAVAIFRGRRTAEAIGAWVQKQTPAATAWFETLEAAEASGRAVAVVAAEAGEAGDRFLEFLRSDEIVAMWKHVAFVREPGKHTKNELVLREAGTGREIGRSELETERLVELLRRVTR